MMKDAFAHRARIMHIGNIVRQGKKLIPQAYTRAYAYYRDYHMRGYIPVLVYQMARVGSSSVYSSLARYAHLRPIQVHMLDIGNLSILQPDEVARPYQETWERKRQHTAQLVDRCAYLLRKRTNVKIITLVREPISRNVSLFFHFFPLYAGMPVETIDTLTTEDLVSIFLRRVRHGIPLAWFDLEIKRALHIDVYAYRFPKGQGHMTIRQGKIDLLVLKNETADHAKEAAIADFLDIADFRLTRENAAADKGYASAYRRFMRQACLPSWYVEAMCRSRYMRHFYSDTEIEQARVRWRGPCAETR
jgi:hypothetical protein